MELVDRYLQAVRFWLPREQQEDVARELSDDILSQIEEEERARGRLLTPDEVEAVLTRRVRPFVVANSYLPQRQLIGPLLFPMYTFVLKLIGVVYVIPWIVVWTCLLAFFPSYRGHVARDHELGSALRTFDHDELAPTEIDRGRRRFTPDPRPRQMLHDSDRIMSP